MKVAKLNMKNVGTGDGAGNGAAIKDVVMQVISVLAANVTDAGGLPDQLKGLLKANVGSVVSQFGAEAQKQIASVVPGDLGKTLSSALKMDVLINDRQSPRRFHGQQEGFERQRNDPIHGYQG